MNDTHTRQIASLDFSKKKPADPADWDPSCSEWISCRLEGVSSGSCLSSGLPCRPSSSVSSANLDESWLLLKQTLPLSRIFARCFEH